jgi:MbtH protein
MNMPERPDPEPRFLVVHNDEEQYSIWAADRDLPAGWCSVGVSGSRQECLDHIERVWTDMRPKSLREAMARSGRS